MSVLDKNLVDGVVLTENKEGIKLILSDVLDWEDEYQHLIALQDKLNAYIAFCEGEQYRKLHKFNNKTIKYGVFEIHFLYEPPQIVMKFLEQVQAQLTELGIKIECYIS